MLVMGRIYSTQCDPALQVPLGTPDPATHQGTLRRGGLWACQAPERPGDVATAWSHACRGCVLHMTTVLATQPSLRTAMVEFRPGPGRATLVTTADAVAWSAERFDDEILRRVAASFGGDPSRVRTDRGRERGAGPAGR